MLPGQVADDDALGNAVDEHQVEHLGRECILTLPSADLPLSEL
jgi:hypothetical protein